MALNLTYTVRDLKFRFPAKTSRGSLFFHTAYYLVLSDSKKKEITGTGEASPLNGLSIDAIPEFEENLKSVCEDFNSKAFQEIPGAWHWLNNQNLSGFPALKFGLETAFLDFEASGKKLLFNSEFSRGEAGIPINGLIWMGDKAFMLEQISRKLNQGFSTLKLKIGGLDFETECDILTAIRKEASPDQLTIRLDANGAFSPQNAIEKLEKLAAFGIHSIEQPIQAGQISEMKKICQESPVPVALDEELIGVSGNENKVAILQQIAPAYIILKPTLLGGFEETRNWIKLARAGSIGWWITSALESNIGLNAIAQFTATFPDLLPQGLGTGQLYHNNIESPLTVERGNLYYKDAIRWAGV